MEVMEEVQNDLGPGGVDHLSIQLAKVTYATDDSRILSLALCKFQSEAFHWLPYSRSTLPKIGAHFIYNEKNVEEFLDKIETYQYRRSEGSP